MTSEGREWNILIPTAVLVVIPFLHSPYLSMLENFFLIHLLTPRISGVCLGDIFSLTHTTCFFCRQVPEYTTGDRQQLYIELHKIINSLDKYKNTVRVLYNPTVQILALPYANRTTVANLARKREVLATGVTKIEFSTDSNENKILTDADPMYSVKSRIIEN